MLSIVVSMELIILVLGAAIGLLGAFLIEQRRIFEHRQSDNRVAEQESRASVQRLIAATARAEEARERLSTLLGAIDTGVIRLDRQLEVQSANLVAHELFDRPAHGMQGRPLLEAILDNNIEEFVRFSASLAQPTGWREFSLGRKKTLLVSLFRAAEGSFWMVIRDISEVARLRKIRTEFAENLSHELRTPVTAMSLLSDLLVADSGELEHISPKFRARVVQMQAEILHLGELITELLELARIESGEDGIRDENVNVIDIVRSAVNRLRPSAEKSGVRIDLARPTVVDATVKGNATRLNQVFVNLLHNAIKFSPQDSSIHVKIVSSQDHCSVEITDCGIGISQADLERVFERFYVADPARTKGGGTGLGLSIARHIVEAHGGTIQVSSSLGEGSTFTVVLPRR